MMIKKTMLSICAVMGILAVMAPAQADDDRRNKGSWQRADHGRHQYVYYPAQQVYFSPASSTWFWLNGGNWQVGATLPARHRVHRGEGVQIVLSSGRPYAQHVYVEENYGRPWRARHRHPVRHEHRGNAGKHHHHAHKHGHKHSHKHDKHNFKHMRHDGRSHGRGDDRD